MHVTQILQLLFVEPTYTVLMEHLEPVSEWKPLAGYLLNDEDGSKTHNIEQDNGGKVSDCKLAMIRLFLRSGDVSWQTVLSALRKSGYKNLADDIEKQL